MDHLGDSHELDNYRRLVSELDLACRHRPRIDIEQILSSPDQKMVNPYLVFHLWPGGTGCKLKQWPVERWVRLAEHFIDSGYRIVLTGAPSQKSANDAVIDAISATRRRFVYNHAGLSLSADRRPPALCETSRVGGYWRDAYGRSPGSPACRSDGAGLSTALGSHQCFCFRSRITP